MENINGIKHQKSDKINNLKNSTLRNYILYARLLYFLLRRRTKYIFYQNYYKVIIFFVEKFFFSY